MSFGSSGGQAPNQVCLLKVFEFLLDTCNHGYVGFLALVLPLLIRTLVSDGKRIPVVSKKFLEFIAQLPLVALEAAVEASFAFLLPSRINAAGRL